MKSKQFINVPQTQSTPKAPTKPKMGKSPVPKLLPPPPTPEEKALMVAKARKLNASAAYLEKKINSKLKGVPLNQAQK